MQEDESSMLAQEVAGLPDTMTQSQSSLHKTDAKQSPVSEALHLAQNTIVAELASPGAQQSAEASLSAEASAQSHTDLHASPQLHAQQQAQQYEPVMQQSLHLVQQHRSGATSPDLQGKESVAAISGNSNSSSSPAAAVAPHEVVQEGPSQTWYNVLSVASSAASEAEQAETQSQQADTRSQRAETQLQQAETQLQQADTLSQAAETSSVADSLDSMQQGSWRDQWSKRQQPRRPQEPQHASAAPWHPSGLMKKMAAASRADQAQPIKVLFASAEEQQQASSSRPSLPAELPSLPVNHLLQRDSHTMTAALPTSQHQAGHATAETAWLPESPCLQQQPRAGPPDVHDSPAKEGTAGGEGDHHLPVSKRMLAASTALSNDSSPENAKNSRVKVRRTSGEFQQVRQLLHSDLIITAQMRQVLHQ